MRLVEHDTTLTQVVPMTHHVFTVALAVVLTFTGVSAAAQSKPNTSGVERAVQKVLNADELKKSKVGIYAIDVETNDVVYAMNEDGTFNPASNMKIFTGALALEQLGPGHVFTTRVAGNVKGDAIDGPIYLIGGGDPLLMWEDLLKLASELRALGVAKVTGGIIVDDTAFASGFTPPGFDQKKEDASFRAPIGAASLNYNAQTVVVRPGAPGQDAVVYPLPPNDYTRINTSVTTSSGTRAALTASATADGEFTKFSVRGKIGENAKPEYVRKRIDNPSLFTGSAFKVALRSVGIEVGDDLKTGKASGVRTLVEHTSPPVAYIVFLMNKWSNNFIAEMLFQHISASGGPSDVKKSPAVMEAFVRDMGIPTKGFKSFNGSGLYKGNLLTPRQVVELLDRMVDRPVYPEFSASLPIAGTDGTLSGRLGKAVTRGTLRGKTGSLNEVTALAGYLTTKSGRTLAYAILINDPPVPAWQLRRMQDEVAEALAGLDN